MAAFDALHERRGAALDRVRAGLVERLAGGDVAVDLVAARARERSPPTSRSRPRCCSSQHSATAVSTWCVRPDEQRQHADGVGGVLRLAEDHVVQHDLGVRAEHRARRQAALQHPLPADRRLGARDALDVVARRARRRARLRRRRARAPTIRAGAARRIRRRAGAGALRGAGSSRQDRRRERS